jgi:hypothetical protein
VRVLVACEYSGRVRDAFAARGHYAMSCDLLPSESPGPHYQGDVRDVLDDGWDLLVARCSITRCRPHCDRHPFPVHTIGGTPMTVKLKPGRSVKTDSGTCFDVDRLCRLILEVQMAAEGDLCGEQREYHLPRLREAKAILMRSFPINFLNALEAHP